MKTSHISVVLLAILPSVAGCDESAEQSCEMSQPAAGGKQDGLDDGVEEPVEDVDPDAPRYNLDFDVPGFFIVRNADDDIPVRAEPREDSVALTALDKDDWDIEVVAVDPTGQWGLIHHPNTERAYVLGEPDQGWVPMEHLENQEIWPIQGLPDHMSCFGNEPSWDFSPPNAFRGPLDESARFLSVKEMLNPEGLTADAPWRVAVMEGDNQRVTLSITPGMCNDGSRSTVFGLTAQAIVESGDDISVYGGCCSLAYFPYG